MAAADVLVSPVDAGVATVTLNRPEKRNALSIAVRDLVSDALDQLAADDDVQCAVLTGAGGVFCAGFDLTEFRVEDPEFEKQLWASSDRFHRTVLFFPLPLVAAVNGPALAGGFDLAVMCDLRIASSTARFAHPEQAWSQIVYGPLEALVGGAAARDLCFTGRTIDATEALRLGLVSTIVDPGRLAGETANVTGMITRAPRSVLMSTKGKALARAGIDPRAATLDL
jgi:enoyl-CoA hydratase/carnithine racemase